MKKIRGIIAFAILVNCASTELLIATPGLVAQILQERSNTPKQEIAPPQLDDQQFLQQLIQQLKAQQYAEAQEQEVASSNNYLSIATAEQQQPQAEESINFETYTVPAARPPPNSKRIPSFPPKNNNGPPPYKNYNGPPPNKNYNGPPRRPGGPTQKFKFQTPQLGEDGGLTITIKLQPQQLQGLLTKTQQPIHLQGFKPGYKPLIAIPQQSASSVNQQTSTASSSSTKPQVTTGSTDEDEGTGFALFWKELKGLMSSMDFRRKSNPTPTAPRANTNNQQQSSNIYNTIAQQGNRPQQQQGNNAFVPNTANAVRAPLQQLVQLQLALPQPTTYQPQSELNPDGQSDSDDNSDSSMLTTLAKSVTQIPTNIDLMFNDMGRIYRKNLFKLRDSLPDMSVVKDTYWPAKNQGKGGYRGDEGFLDAYGA